MDEFLQRRYCRFVNRKKHKSKMNAEEGVTFKVRRFLQDIDKYNEKKKKKKERKEVKIKETNISLQKNKGIYKNAVLSFPGIKELNCSASARLKGDLIALTKRPNEENDEKRSEAKILERDVQNKREAITEKNEILDKHLEAPSLTNSHFIRVQEISDVQQGLDNNAINNNAEEDIIIESDSESDHYRSVKETNLVEENKENLFLFSKLDHDQIMEREEEKHENNFNENFELVSPKKKEIIFDLFNTPERTENLKYTLFNNTPDGSTPKWEAFNEDCPENFNSKRTKQKSSTKKSLSEDIFGLSSRDNDIQNNFPLYPEVRNQGFKNIQQNEFNCLQEGRQDKIEPSTSHIPRVNSLKPVKLFNNDCKFNTIFRENPPDNFVRLNNSLPYFIPKKDVNVFYKKPVCFVDYDTKFEQKRIKRKTSSMKKEELLKDQYLFKKSNVSRKELFGTKEPVLNCNQRFKKNWKFSPHKYC